MKNRAIIWLLLALCLGGVILFWMATPREPSAIPVEKPVPAYTPPPSPERPTVSATPPPARPEEKTPAVATIWERQINDALSSSINEDQTAQVLINMLPTMPDEGKVEAAQHIANLLSDEKYQAVMPVLVNPSMPEGVHEALFTDLMNRDDTVKLRAFAEIAKAPGHRMGEEALGDLQIFLNEDFGSDWARWNAAIEAYLARQKQEEGAAPQFNQ
jgi:hypothetical protein